MSPSFLLAHAACVPRDTGPWAQVVARAKEQSLNVECKHCRRGLYVLLPSMGETKSTAYSYTVRYDNHLALHDGLAPHGLCFEYNSQRLTRGEVIDLLDSDTARWILFARFACSDTAACQRSQAMVTLDETLASLRSLRA